jgi:hypothetical protein
MMLMSIMLVGQIPTERNNWLAIIQFDQIKRVTLITFSLFSCIGRQNLSYNLSKTKSSFGGKLLQYHKFSMKMAESGFIEI